MKLAASLSDPRQQLQLITWNVGSFARHRTDILGVLAATAPHIFCLQECPLGNSGGINALRADMRPLGYVVHSSGNLVVLAKRGLNIAPIRSLAGDDDFRMQRFALLVGSTRILIRHRHAPSDGPSNRRVLNNLLAAEPMGDLVIDIGDFNEYPSASPGRCILFPDGFTYRHQPRNDANYTSTSCIDGAVVSDLLSHETSADIVPTRALTQHLPVRVTMGLTPDFHKSFRWVVSDPIPMGAWTDQAADEFARLLPIDIDAAWAQWLVASGGPQSSIQSSEPHGGFSVGQDHIKLRSLFRRYRQLSAKCTAHTDDIAADVLSAISAIIDFEGEQRLRRWRAAVSSRKGAARWIRNRMAHRTEAALPPLSSALFTANQIAHQLADELARRWNAGVFIFPREGNPSTCFADGTAPTVSQLRAAPAPRQREPLDLTLFTDAPPLPPMSPWSPELVLEFLPSGTAGLDGQSAEWLQSLHNDSLTRLALLLDAADDGRLPRFWSVARVTLIPKGDGSSPSDRRPITVLPICYRLWAKRRAHLYNGWLATWRPHGLSGAISGVSCPDVLWEVMGALDDARMGRRRPAYVLSLDQEKCFDRLFIDALDEICTHLGLHSEAVFENYRHLARLLFVDGQPSDVWLQGEHLCGIPQGCPLATFYCNLTALAWHRLCERHTQRTNASFFSYLDDRFPILPNWSTMQAIFDATKAFDLSYGPALNVRKSFRGVAHIAGARRAVVKEPSAGTLLNVSRVKTLRYLGADVQLGGRDATSGRPVAALRCRNLMDRCRFIRSLPRRQRPALVADAMSSLWLAGCTSLGSVQLGHAVSHTFAALAGNRCTDGQIRRRSRAVGHLLGPAPHVTHAACATI